MLRNRSLIGLFSAELVSLTGSSMTLLALPWFVLATTGSTAKMGWVLAARVAPQALLGIPAGSLIHRLGAKRTMLVADAARGPLMAIIPILFWTGHLSFAALLVVTFAVGSFSAPYAASAALLVPEVVGDDERLVARAGAIVGTSTQITQIAGPVLAGVLISVTSPATVLVVDGGTFVFSFLTILLTVRAGKRVEQAAQARGLLAGVRFLFHDSLLGPIVLAACVLNFVVPGLLVGLNTLAFFHFHSNAHVAGFFYGSLGVGALLGAILAQHLTKTIDLLKISALAIVAMPLPVWLLSIALPWPAVVVVVGAFSFFTPLVNAPLIGIFTVRVPAALRPKAMTAMLTFATLAGPLGYLLAGFAFGHVSVYRAFFVIAVALTLGSLAFAAILLRHRASIDCRPGIVPRVRRVIVRYKVKPDRVAENEALVRAVYEELAATQPGDMRYGTFKLDDGVSFVHIHSNDDPSDHNPLLELASFRAFQAGLGDRCDEPPVVSQLDEIGTFRLF